MSLDLLQVVLVQTRFPENIGMAARACVNMGSPSIRLVAPERWDREKARPLATPKGQGVLDDVQVLPDVSAAVADCSLVIGTTARTGGWRRSLLSPEQAAGEVAQALERGEKVAIVGPSGGGKTTLCNLIPRFYDVSEGRILLDGQDIKHFTLKSLRGNIGIVQQDVYLFSGTIYENIAYGRPGASKEDVINAAKRAGAHEFIMGLKDGYDTYVGERGVKLSGGQKQRISIARVFLKNPPIIILDEATSALDNESEFAVAKSLGELSEGRTTLTIAHRLSSIRNSDRILVLTDDGIVEEGNHDQLMEQKGIYYQFYETANALK